MDYSLSMLWSSELTSNFFFFYGLFFFFIFFSFFFDSVAARSILFKTIEWAISPGVIFPLANDPNALNLPCTVSFPPPWYAPENTCLPSSSRDQFTNTTIVKNKTSTSSRSNCTCAEELLSWEESTRIFVISTYAVTVLILATNILLPPLLLGDVPTTGLRAIRQSCIS